MQIQLKLQHLKVDMLLQRSWNPIKISLYIKNFFHQCQMMNYNKFHLSYLLHIIIIFVRVTGTHILMHFLLFFYFIVIITKTHLNVYRLFIFNINLMIFLQCEYIRICDNLKGIYFPFKKLLNFKIIRFYCNKKIKLKQFLILILH